LITRFVIHAPAIHGRGMNDESGDQSSGPSRNKR
jgi:hypothetical protein